MQKKETIEAKSHWNCTDLAEIISHETGVSPKAAHVVLEKMGEVICEHMTRDKDNSVYMTGFGRFFIRCWKGRQIKLGDKLIHTVDHPHIAFKPTARQEKETTHKGWMDYSRESTVISRGNGK